MCVTNLCYRQIHKLGCTQRRIFYYYATSAHFKWDCNFRSYEWSTTLACPGCFSDRDRILFIDFIFKQNNCTFRLFPESVGRLRTECILFGLLPQLSFSVGKPEMSCTGNDVFGFGTTRCGDRNLLPYLIHRNVFSPRFRVGLRWTSVSPIATNCRLTEKCVHFQATKKKATRFYRIIYCVWTLSAKSGMTWPWWPNLLVEGHKIIFMALASERQRSGVMLLLGTRGRVFIPKM